MLKNICICRRAADALPSGRKAGGTANNANNANQAKINIFPILSSDSRRPLRIRLDWDSLRQHLTYLRDLRDLRLKTVLRHAALRSTLRRGKVVDVSLAAWPWPFASARAWFTGMTGRRTLLKSWRLFLCVASGRGWRSRDRTEDRGVTGKRGEGRVTA